MGNTKIGISNFKAFGPKMQYFTKKPITLIYGPNSVGKSSLIRALLFKEYLKSAKGKFHYEEPKIENESNGLIDAFIRGWNDAEPVASYAKTDQFGDTYDIGTFKSTIHMHDISNTINYDIEYFNHWDLYRLVPLYALFGDTLLLRLDSMSIDDVFDSVDAYSIKNENEYTENEKLLEKLVINKCKNICAINTNDLKISDNLERFKAFVRYVLFQSLIKSVKVKTSVHNGFTSEHMIFVNDVLLFKCIVANQSGNVTNMLLEIYTDNKVFDLVFFKPENIDIHDKYVFNFEYLPHDSFIYVDVLKLEKNYSAYLEKYVKQILKKILLPNQDFENIYIGPIRAIPERNDLGGHRSFYKRQRRKQIKIDKANQKCIEISKLMYFLRESKYLNFIYWMIFIPKFMLCSLIKYIRTFYNSIFITAKGMLKLIRQNSNKNHYLWHSLIESKKVRNKVNDWLKNKGKHNSSYILNIDGADASSFRELKFYDESTKTNVHPQDMGVGISQSLPIIIACNLYQYANIFIEQPELHLHPKLQMELADEFIRSIHQNENAFMLESHSEHMLLRIMKRMRQTAEGTLEDESLRLTPDDVCLLYVDNNDELTYLNELELDNDGTLLDPWPGGFFEEGYNERFS